MSTSHRLTIVLTAAVTAAVLGIAAAIFISLDETPSPSIAPMAAADGADTDEFQDPWAEHAERCEPVLDVVWGPTEEDLERIRAQNQELMTALDDAGVAYELITEDNGWEHVAPTDGDHEAFERVIEDFWGSDLGAPSEEDLARMREENAALAAHLDDQGIEYEIVTEPDGWEHVEPADEDGWEAMNAFWQERERADVRERAEAAGLDVEEVLSCFDEERELAGMYDGFDPFPFPMDLRMASEQKSLVEELMAAFDEAGIEYQRLDVPFVQWDRSDDTATDIVRRIAEQHGWSAEEIDGGMMVEEQAVEEDTAAEGG